MNIGKIGVWILVGFFFGGAKARAEEPSAETAPAVDALVDGLVNIIDSLGIVLPPALRPCLDNNQCGPQFYCSKPAMRCDSPGRCRRRPQSCPENYDPVCGCNGQTYDNACFAAMAGVSVAHPGACPQLCGGIAGIPCDDGEFCRLRDGECCCDFQGVCHVIPPACPDVWDPVCGCDGITYGNRCEADTAGVSVDHVGACVRICGGFAGIPCPDGEFCLFREGECCCDFQGVCHVIPPACPDVWDPVCGCDGHTYSNACDAFAAGVSIDHAGVCRR